MHAPEPRHEGAGPPVHTGGSVSRVDDVLAGLRISKVGRSTLQHAAPLNLARSRLIE
jgi:hypothetical protein